MNLESLGGVDEVLLKFEDLRKNNALMQIEGL